jgi:6-phosphogluconolactonase
VALSPSGRIVVASNRGHDTLAVFDFDSALTSLRLRRTQPLRGRTPRAVAFAPDGRFLLAASQDDDVIESFSLDEASWTLAPRSAYCPAR